MQLPKDVQISEIVFPKKKNPNDNKKDKTT